MFQDYIVFICHNILVMLFLCSPATTRRAARQQRWRWRRRWWGRSQGWRARWGGGGGSPHQQQFRAVGQHSIRGRPRNSTFFFLSYLGHIDHNFKFCSRVLLHHVLFLLYFLNLLNYFIGIGCIRKTRRAPRPGTDVPATSPTDVGPLLSWILPPILCWRWHAHTPIRLDSCRSLLGKIWKCVPPPRIFILVKKRFWCLLIIRHLKVFYTAHTMLCPKWRLFLFKNFSHTPQP